MLTIEALRERPNFDHLVNQVRTAGTDNLSHFGNGYTHEGGLSLQQNPEEFAALLALIGETSGQNYLEIGSASGGAAKMLHEYAHFKTMVSIDDGGHHRYPELQHNFLNLPIVHYRGDSHHPAAQRWLQNQRLKYHVVFIDGDHSETGVWEDVLLTQPFWAPGAKIILHDIVACAGVHKAWDRGEKENRWKKVAQFIGSERPLGIGVGEAL